MKVHIAVGVATVMIGVSLFSAAQAPNSQPSFVRTDFAAGQEPSGIVSADFDGDGKLDLAIASFSADKISILSGNGDGSFRPKRDIPSSGLPCAMAVGDFNNDGFADLLVAGWSAVSVLLGKGDGTFGSPEFLFSYAAVGAAVGDFNADGKADAVWSTWDTAYLSLGNGDGTFQKTIDLKTGAWSPCLITADLNRDGKLDLVVTWSDGASGGVSILLGLGNGTFIPAGIFPSGGDAMGSAAAGDLNRDSIPDLILVNHKGSISILRGKGDGTFAAAVDYPVIYAARGVVLADYDGDGSLDAAVAATGSTLSILMGKGDGSFQPAVNLAAAAVDHNGLLAIDLNEDRKPDLAISNSANVNSVSVFVNTLGVSKPPRALCGNVTVPAGPGCTASASVDAGSFAGVNTAKLSVSQNPPGPYPLGQTNATLTVSDALGGFSQCSGTITVVDSTPPAITLWSATPAILWPVNGKMKPVNLTAMALDSCTHSVSCRISHITSNEPVSAVGDWMITGKLTANLRAERLGTGAGRKYTLTIECADAAGNKATKDIVILVPHDQGK